MCKKLITLGPDLINADSNNDWSIKILSNLCIICLLQPQNNTFKFRQNLNEAFVSTTEIWSLDLQICRLVFYQLSHTTSHKKHSIISSHQIQFQKQFFQQWEPENQEPSRSLSTLGSEQHNPGWGKVWGQACLRWIHLKECPPLQKWTWYSL